LKQQGIYDRAIILLLSDHGEGLGDHGEREHGIFLYREALHVPLMVKLPGRRAAGQTVDATVGLIDIAPTIARLLGAAAPSSWSGTPLLGPPRDPRGNRRVYSESIYGRLHLGWSELRSLVDAGHHFIEAPRPELYDLARDPQEKQNILAESRRVYAGFRDEMATFPRELKQPAPATSEEQKKLAALGYLTGSPDSTAASIDPKDGIVDLSLYEEAKEFARQRKYDRAITAYRTLLEKNPRFSDALTQLAALYETTGRYMEAEAAYRELLRQNPASAEHVAIALGVVYMNLRRYAEAESHAALALHSNPGGAHLVIGRVRMAVGDYAGAERHAREATSDVHFRSQAVLLLAESLVKQRKADRALAALDAERSELRVARAAPVRSLELGRGNALIHVGRIAEAEAAFREADEYGKDPEPGLSLLRLGQGNVKGALSSIRRALSDDSLVIAARVRLLPPAVEIAIAAEEPEEAQRYVDELVEAADTYDTSALKASGAFAQGNVKLAQGDAAGAYNCLRQARTFWDATGATYDVARTREALGHAARLDGDEERALWEFQAAAARFERLGALRDAERLADLLAVKRTVMKTFLFTDIVKSTDLLSTIEDRHWANALRLHDDALRSIFADWDGQVVDHTGDGFFVAFDDAEKAVRAAIAVQKTVDQEFVFDVRIGVHTDGALQQGETYHGRGVHAAARIGAQAEGREILGSRETLDAVEGFPTKNPRAATLKGFKEPVPVCSVDWERR